MKQTTKRTLPLLIILALMAHSISLRAQGTSVEDDSGVGTRLQLMAKYIF